MGQIHLFRNFKQKGAEITESEETKPLLTPLTPAQPIHVSILVEIQQFTPNGRHAIGIGGPFVRPGPGRASRPLA